MIKKYITIFILCQFLLAPSIVAKVSQDAEARAYFFAAEVAYDDKQYQKAIDAANKVEKMLGKGNAKLSSLRVKSLFALKKHSETKAEIKRFYGYKSSNTLSKEIASILLKVDDEIVTERKKRLLEEERERWAKIRQSNANKRNSSIKKNIQQAKGQLLKEQSILNKQRDEYLTYINQKKSAVTNVERRQGQKLSSKAGKVISNAFDLYEVNKIEQSISTILTVVPENEYDRAYADYFLGILYATNNNNIQALPFLKKALSSKLLSTENDIDIINLVGQILVSSGKKDEGVKYYEKVFSYTEGVNEKTLSHIALAHYSIDENGPYVGPALLAWDKSKKASHQLLNLLLQYTNKNKLNFTSIILFKQKLAINPEKKYENYMLSQLYLLVEDYSGALPYLEKLHNSGLLDGEQELKYLISTYAASFYFSQSAKLLENLINKGTYKKTQKNYLELANLYHNDGDIRNAAKYIGVSASMTNNAALYLKQGMLLNEINEFNVAITALLKALKYGLKDVDKLNFALGESYYGAENYKLSKQFFEKCLKSPDWAGKAKKWLDYLKNENNT